MVGDGITDLEAVQESGGADMFVGFGGERAGGARAGMLGAARCLLPPPLLLPTPTHSALARPAPHSLSTPHPHSPSRRGDARGGGCQRRLVR